MAQAEIQEREATVAPPKVVTQAMVLDTLEKLRPHHVVGGAKIRCGSPHDGGYILIDDFGGAAQAFSFGVETNDDWDLELAGRGLEVHQFDHSVERAPSTHPNLRFHRTKIAPVRAEGCATFEDLISGCTAPDLIVKMDIEFSEWDVLDATDTVALARCRQLCVEFHGLEQLAHADFLARANRVFSKLAATHGVFHVHANNYGPIANVLNISVPCVLEISFGARSRYVFAKSDEIFPGQLDTPNNPRHPDIRLGTFSF